MRYKRFHNADIDVSVIGVGTWAIGGDGYGEVNEADSIAGIRAMLEQGVNLVDTAPAYGSGYAETIVGKAISGYDRSKLLISTKVGIGATTLKAKKGFKGFARDSSFDNILYECEQSLRRLNTDHIDFYFIHWPDFDMPFAETADALNTLKKENKIRYIGVSNFSRQQIEELGKYCQIDVIQPPFSMLASRDRELMKWAKEKGIDNFTYGSLGAGILSGKYREVPSFGPRDPRNHFYPYYKEPLFSKVMKLLEVMDGISEETGRPLVEIVLNWTVQKDFVSTTLCGIRNADQAKQDCQAFDWLLSDEQMRTIDEAIDTYIDFDGVPPME